jgi:hypothetical protein
VRDGSKSGLAKEPANRLSILFTNITLAGRTGTEVMVSELAVALHRLGHRVAIYSPRLGALARQVRGLGVPVTDRIDKLGFSPDVIHGHHNIALAIAMVRFPHAPAIFVCHDTAQVYDTPVLSPQVIFYVAVDPACRERLEVEGAPSEAIRLIPNGVDLSVFPFKERLNAFPATALAITKHRAPWLPLVRTACGAQGIALTEVGFAVGREVDDLPSRLLNSDLVFAWSRSAAEAAATGAGVILCDEFGFGGLLTCQDVQSYPENRLGRRCLSQSISQAAIEEAIHAHSPKEAARAAKLVRKKLSLEHMVKTYEALYHDAIAAPQTCAPNNAMALAAFLQRAMPRFDLPSEFEAEQDALDDRLLRLNAWLNDAEPVEFGPVAFSHNCLGATLLGSGWGVPEASGVWTQAQTARLDLPVSLIQAWDGCLIFECFHYFPANETVRVKRAVEVRLRNKLVAHWHFEFDDLEKSNTCFRRLDLSLTSSEIGTVPLQFIICAPARPFEEGESDDTRLLGLYLKTISSAQEPKMHMASQHDSPATPLTLSREGSQGDVNADGQFKQNQAIKTAIDEPSIVLQ